MIAKFFYCCALFAGAFAPLLSRAQSPIIQTQPASQTAVENAEVGLRVSATGALPLFYQWHFNSTAIPSATNSLLLISQVSDFDAGSYHAVVFNAAGSTLSSNAELVVDSGLVREEWRTRFNEQGNSPEEFRQMAVDSSGAVYVVGSSRNTNNETQLLLLKYSPAGNLLWKRIYQGPIPLQDEGRSLAIDSSGNIYVSGLSLSELHGYDFITLKYDPVGNLLWESRFDSHGHSHDEPITLALGPDGGVAVAGNSWCEGVAMDFLVVRYDANGKELWSQRYNGPGNDDESVKALKFDLQGNLILTGSSPSENGDQDIAVVKYGPQGNQLWVRRYDGPDHFHDEPYTLAVDLNGNIHIGASSEDQDGAPSLILKYDPNGALLWTVLHRENQYGYNRSTALLVDGSGNVFATGNSYDYSADHDFLTTKYNSQGQTVWVARYGWFAGDFPMAIAQDAAGNTYVAGNSSLPGTDYDFVVVKYDPDGSRQWVARFNGLGSSPESLTALALTQNSEIILGGVSDDAGTGNDIRLVKYSQLPVAFPQIVSAPQSQVTTQGLTVSMTVTATGLGALSYQWYKDFTPLTDSTNTLLEFTEIDPYQAGRYSVRVTDANGTVESVRAQLVVLYRPYIFGEPQDRGVFEGTETSLHVLTDGTNPLNFQWFFNDAPLLDATNALLTISKVDEGHVGSYFVVVGNMIGSVTSAPAFLEIIEGPVGEIWRRNFDGGAESYDQAVAIKTDALGFIYVTGWSLNSNYVQGIATVKYTPDGKTVWTTHYPNADPAAIEVDSEGNVYICGYNQIYSSSSDFLIIKYDSNGNEMWVQTYNGPGDGLDKAKALYLLDDEFLYVAGESEGGASDSDFALIRYSIDGQLEWVSRYNGAANGREELGGLTVDITGQAFIAGGSGNAAGGMDLITVKYLTNGAQSWVARLPGFADSTNRATSITWDQDIHVIVAGFVYSDATSNDFAVIQYDAASGNQNWIRFYDAESNDDRPKAVVTDDDGNIFVTGSSWTDETAYDFTTIKYDDGGNELWVRRYDSIHGYYDEPSAMVIDSAGSVFITGSTDPFGGTYDYFTLKYSSDGELAWTASLQGPVGQEDFAAAIALDSTGGIYVTGFSQGGGTLHDFSTVKYLETFPVGNDLPEIEIVSPESGTTLEGPVGISVQAWAADFDGLIARVEFFEGNTLIGTATTEPYEVTWIQSEPGTYVLMARVIDDQGGITYSEPARVKVVFPVEINDAPVSINLNLDQPLMLSVDAEGTGLTYQWRRNGVNIPEANDSTYTLDGIQFWEAGSFSVVVANEISAITTDSVDVTVNNLTPLALSDAFESAPVDFEYDGLYRATNNGASLQAGEPDHAGNSGGQSVWLRWVAPANGIATFTTEGSTFDTLLAAYTGATLSSLIEVESDDDRGGFLTSTIVFNADMGVEYAIAIDGFSGAEGTIVLTWRLEEGQEDIPIIRFDPEDQTVARGATVDFTVLVTSPTPIRYQWLYNCQTIPNATNVILKITNVQAEHVGGYSVLIQNDSKIKVESFTAYLELGPNTEAQSEDKFEELSSNGGQQGLARAQKRRAFTSVAAGTPGTQVLNNFGSTTETGEPNHGGQVGGSSRWFDLRPATNGTLTVDTIGSEIDTVVAVYTGTDLFSLVLIADDDNGAPDRLRSVVRFQALAGTSYLVAVDGVNGVQGNIQLNWGLGNFPQVTVSPTNATVARGGNLSLNALTAGTGPLQFRWRFNGVELSGQTNAVLNLSNIQSTNAGSYTVEVSNFLGTATNTPPAVLTVTGPPVITVNPASEVVAAGSPVTFGVLANGTPPFSYQWHRNNTPISGAANRTLTITNVQSINAGNYSVVVANSGGSVTSSPPAVLTVQLPPVITSSPTNERVPVGSMVQLMVGATGTGPLSYQWRLNGFAISGETNNMLMLVNIQFNQSGRYSVSVSNQVRMVTSSEAVLTVYAPLVFAPTEIRASNGVFYLRQTGGAGTSNPVVIEVSTNLTTWQPVFTNSTGNPATYSEPMSNRFRRFFRARF